MINVREAVGRELDALVAKAEKLEGFMTYDGRKPIAYHIYTDPADTKRRDDLRRREHWNPTTNWSQGGPIIQQEKIEVFFDERDFSWGVSTGCKLADYVKGPTLLVAAMRAFVISKLGDEVEL